MQASRLQTGPVSGSGDKWPAMQARSRVHQFRFILCRWILGRSILGITTPSFEKATIMTEPAPRPVPPRHPARAALPPGIDAADLRRLAAALAAAADVVRRLLRGAGDGPAGVRSAWPDMIRATRFSVPGTRVTTPCRPGPADIAAMERMIALLWEVNARQRQLLWARACGVRWAVLQDRFRRSRTTLNRDYRGALAPLGWPAFLLFLTTSGNTPMPVIMLSSRCQLLLRCFSSLRRQGWRGADGASDG